MAQSPKAQTNSPRTREHQRAEGGHKSPVRSEHSPKHSEERFHNGDYDVKESRQDRKSDSVNQGSNKGSDIGSKKGSNKGRSLSPDDKAPKQQGKYVQGQDEPRQDQQNQSQKEHDQPQQSRQDNDLQHSRVDDLKSSSLRDQAQADESDESPTHLESEKTRKPKLNDSIVSKNGDQPEGKDKILELQLLLDDKLRQIKSLKQELKGQKQRSILLEIQLSAIRSEHSKCSGQSSKDLKSLYPSKNLTKEQKLPLAKGTKQDDDFWNLEPPEIIRRKRQQQSLGSQDYLTDQSQSLKSSPLVKTKNTNLQPVHKQSQIRVKRVQNQPMYDQQQYDFWNADLPESLKKRKQDLVHDSGLWINQMQQKNPRLPSISTPVRPKK